MFHSNQYNNFSLSQWDLICDRGHLRFTITTIQMVGTLIGACVTGQLADMYGRRRVLYTVYILLLAAGLGSAFSSSWQMFTIFRFFVGAFFGGMYIQGSPGVQGSSGVQGSLSVLCHCLS